jgi:fumarate reductase (CoM/CoB) subunit A
MHVRTDVLIIGAGGAGVRAAIEASVNDQNLNIVLLNQGPVGRSGLTAMANGGMQWVSHPEDSPDAHFRDVVRIGCYLNDQNLIEVMTEEAPERAEELLSWGAEIEMDGDQYYLSDPRGSGASFPRSHFIQGGTYMPALRNELVRHSNVTVMEDYAATKLLSIENRVIGATAINIRNGEQVVIESKATVVAAGGLGELYLHTTNTPWGLHGHAAGTGYALAYHAGAELMDMEMVQFTNIQIYPPWELGNPALLSSVCGGKYVNALGEEYMQLPQPRDMLQKLALKEIKEGRGTERGGVYIDLSFSPLSREDLEAHLKKMLGGETAKGRWKLLKEMSVDNPDPRNWKVEWAPGCEHFFMGGVRINEMCETRVEGLYAAGAEHIEPELTAITDELKRTSAFFKPEGIPPKAIRDKIRTLMSDHMGVARNETDLKKALSDLISIRANDLPKLRAPQGRRFNLGWIEAIEVVYMLDVAEMMVKSALSRTESRGGHYREDYPNTEKSWLKHTLVKKKNDTMVVDTAPVVITKLNVPGD